MSPQVEQRAAELMPGVKAGIEGRDSPDWLAVDAGEQQTKALSCLPGLSMVQGNQCRSGPTQNNQGSDCDCRLSGGTLLHGGCTSDV